MADLRFQTTLQASGAGMLWVLWRVHSAKGTGLLTVEWDKFKKQIAFKNGEPTATKSNWLQESFGQFLVRKKRIDMPTLHNELKAMEADAASPQLGEWLATRGKLESQEMPELLEGHFRERLFNLLVLSRGQVQFEPVNDQALLNIEAIRLTDPFLKLLWDAARVLFTEAWCRGRIGAQANREVQLKGSCPLPLSPQELRAWNDLCQKSKVASACDEMSLRLVAAAIEFDQVSWSSSAEEKALSEMIEFETKIQTAKTNEILGVEASASAEDCKRAYLELVKKFHPDRMPTQNKPELKQMSEKLFAKINEAYSTMTDPEKRKEYDAQIELDANGGMEKIQARLQAEMLIPQAKMALRRRHFQAALEALKSIEAELTNDGEIIADRVYAEAMCVAETKGNLKGKIPALKQDLQRAMKLKENNADAYYYRGMLNKLDGDQAKALADFDRALQINPRLTEAGTESRVLRSRMDKKSLDKKK